MKCANKKCRYYGEHIFNGCEVVLDIAGCTLYKNFLTTQKDPVAKLQCSAGLDAFRAKLAEGFITCETREDNDYFVKVKFKRLKDTQQFHTELLKIAGGI